MDINSFKKISSKIDELNDKVAEAIPFNPGKHSAEARLRITRIFLKWFFSLIISFFILGCLYNIIVAHLNMELALKGDNQLEYLNLINTVSLITTSLSGSVGFLIGFYFKNKDEKE